MGLTARLKLLDRPTFHLLSIAFLGLIIYSNTFSVPFQWDDRFYIKENSIVKDIGYFLSPSKAEGHEYYGALKGRYIGYLTFALNYKFNGLDVRGYHVVNIAIHILNAVLVYFLVVLTFRTPFLSESFLKEKSGYIALFSALLFVSHPIQTEAVTYIFQRLASLMAFFYLLSLVLYIKWRLTFYPPFSKRGRGGIFFYFLSLLSAVLAMKTKENAFTLPVTIALYEVFFFDGPIKKRLLWFTPFLLTMLIIPISLAGADKPIGEVIGGLATLPGGYEGVSRGDYFFTQSRVIVTYIRLLFLPINQTVDYDYPIFSSFSTPGVLLSFLFLLSLLSLAVYLFYSSKDRPELRLVSFGIFWFFIALSVESGIVPLPKVIDEYRLYLPSVGVFAAVAAFGYPIINKFKTKSLTAAKFTIAVNVAIIFALVSSTYTRNDIWRDRVALWEDTVNKSPLSTTAHNNLGNAFMDKGALDKAVYEFQAALRLNPDHTAAHYSIGVAYSKCGLLDKAIDHFQRSIALDPNYPDSYNDLGAAYARKGLLNEAITNFRKALEINPSNTMAQKNFNHALNLLGAKDEKNPLKP